MYVPKDEVLEQFKQSPNLLGMMVAHGDEYNALIDTFDKFIDSYSLATAIGTQLDALGYLLGLERPITRELDKYFTFVGGTGKGFGNRYGTVDGGELIGYTESGVALASDTEYRKLLYLKLYANLSRTTPNDLIQTVNAITGTQCILTEGYEGLIVDDTYVLNHSGVQIINSAGAEVLAMKPLNVREPAKVTLQVLGAEDDEYRIFLESYLAKPLGVRLTIEPYPILDTPVETITYTGTDTSNTLATAVDMTHGLQYFKNVSGVGGNMIVTTITGERNAVPIDDTDPARDIGVSIITKDETVLIAGSNDANKLNDEYMLFSIPMPTRDISQTSDLLPAEHLINNATGFAVVSWIGSGSYEQHIPLPFTSTPSMIMAKSLNGGDMTMVGGLLEGKKLIINSDAPLADDTSPELRLLSAGIAVNGGYNVKDEVYFGWIINENRAYSVVDGYKSSGILQFTISLGFEPSIIMIKRTDKAGDWLYFSKDLIGATLPKTIRMNSDQPATDDGFLEFTDLGFKLMTNDSNSNEIDGLYSYIAIRV